MKKRVNLFGLRWSIKELAGMFAGMVVAIIFLLYVSTKPYFFQSLGVIVGAIAVLIGALSLKRTIDTVRPFLTLTKTELYSNTKTELLLDESLNGIMRLNIRNTGSTPAEKISIQLSISTLESQTTSGELMSQVIKGPTIFPTEERVITYYPSPELLKLIEAEKAKITINMTYQSAQNKYYTTRIMNILVEGWGEGRFIFNFVGSEDFWD